MRGARVGGCISGDTEDEASGHQDHTTWGETAKAGTNFAPGLLHANRQNGLVPDPLTVRPAPRFASLPNAPFLFGF